MHGLAFTWPPNHKFAGVEWEALDERARLVAGRLVLHAAVSETEVVSWAEVVVERSPGTGE